MKFLSCLVFLLLSAAPWLPADETRGAPPGTPPAPEALPALDARYAEDRAGALRRVLARYVDELEALEKSLVTAGDASGAARVRLERDRVLPALGLPVVTADDASEFAAFEEETTPAPVPPVPAVLPGDLQAILQTLLPAGAAPAPPEGAAPAPPGSGAMVPGRGTKRLLRMSNAQLQGTYEPLSGHYYWTRGKSASWTLNDLPPGSYQLVLRYACDGNDDGGGKVEARFGTGKLEVKVPSTGGWKRRRELVIGPFQIADPRADLVLKSAPSDSVASYLMDLTALVVQPADPAEKPGTP